MPQVLWHVVIDLCGQRWKRGSNAGACGFLESLVAFFLWMEVGHSKYTPPKNNASQPWICLYLSAWLSSKTEKRRDVSANSLRYFLPPNGAIGLTDLQIPGINRG